MNTLEKCPSDIFISFVRTHCMQSNNKQKHIADIRLSEVGAAVAAAFCAVSTQMHTQSVFSLSLSPFSVCVFACIHFASACATYSSKHSEMSTVHPSLIQSVWVHCRYGIALGWISLCHAKCYTYIYIVYAQTYWKQTRNASLVLLRFYACKKKERCLFPTTNAHARLRTLSRFSFYWFFRSFFLSKCQLNSWKMPNKVVCTRQRTRKRVSFEMFSWEFCMDYIQMFHVSRIVHWISPESHTHAHICWFESFNPMKVKKKLFTNSPWKEYSRP